MFKPTLTENEYTSHKYNFETSARPFELESYQIFISKADNKDNSHDPMLLYNIIKLIACFWLIIDPFLYSNMLLFI